MKRSTSNSNLIACFLVVVIVGYLDYITGYEINFGFFYILPIIAATSAGQRGGTYAIALLCVAAMSAADCYSGRPYTHGWFFFWNIGIRLLSFLTVAYLANWIPQSHAVPLAQENKDALVPNEFTALYIPYENRLSIANKAARFVWTILWLLLFRPAPQFLHGWRVFLLRCFGARIGRRCRIAPSCRVWAPWNLSLGDDCQIGSQADCYSVDHIAIGHRVIIGPRVYLCTASHDVNDPRLALIHAPIRIAADARIEAQAFLLPGITIGQGSIVSACAVLTHDVAAWTVVSGNPAQVVRKRELPMATA